MTHDPREALKPCPFCGGEAERIDIPTVGSDPDLGGDPNAGGSCIQCKRCTASTALHFDRKENLYSSWNDRCGRALTASPGEQKPVAAACADWGQLVQCLLRTMDHPHKGESSTEQAERMATELCRKYPPPPAAGWNEAIEAAMTAIENMRVKGAANLVDARHQGQRGCDYTDTLYDAYQAVKALRREAPAPEGVSTTPSPVESNGSVEAEFPAWTEEDKAYELGRRDGYELAVQDIDLATGGDGEFKGSTIPGETVDVSAMKARIIGRVTSNASVEARLREALRDVCSLFDDEGNFREEHQDHASTALEKAERAMALFSRGDEATKSEGVPGKQSASGAATAPIETEDAEVAIRPSDPTAERGEIVARIVRLFIGTEVKHTEYGFRYSSKAFDKMVSELSALDGGAGA